METVIICICFGIAIGAAIMIVAWQMHDKAMWNELDNALNHNDYCESCCPYYEKCYSMHKDPDEAVDELIHNYCYNCPLEQAREIVENHLK